MHALTLGGLKWHIETIEFDKLNLIYM